MSKQDAVEKIKKLLVNVKGGEVADEEITDTIKSAIENKVLETLLDGLEELIKSIRTVPPC